MLSHTAVSMAIAIKTLSAILSAPDMALRELRGRDACISYIFDVRLWVINTRS